MHLNKSSNHLRSTSQSKVWYYTHAQHIHVSSLGCLNLLHSDILMISPTAGPSSTVQHSHLNHLPPTHTLRKRSKFPFFRWIHLLPILLLLMTAYLANELYTDYTTPPLSAASEKVNKRNVGQTILSSPSSSARGRGPAGVSV